MQNKKISSEQANSKDILYSNTAMEKITIKCGLSIFSVAVITFCSHGKQKSNLLFKNTDLKMDRLQR